MHKLRSKKTEKKLQQEILEQLTHKESIIDIERMTDLVEIEKSSDMKIQTLEKGTNIGPTDIKNQKDACIEIIVA